MPGLLRLCSRPAQPILLSMFFLLSPGRLLLLSHNMHAYMHRFHIRLHPSSCDVAFEASALPALEETLAEACALPTRNGKGARPCLCISHQKRSRLREDSFFARLAKRLGRGGWQMVHRRDDLSVFIFSCS